MSSATEDKGTSEDRWCAAIEETIATIDKAVDEARARLQTIAAIAELGRSRGQVVAIPVNQDIVLVRVHLDCLQSGRLGAYDKELRKLSHSLQPVGDGTFDIIVTAHYDKA